MKKFLFTACILGTLALSSAAQACHYDDAQVQKDMSNAKFIGMVKIIKVEQSGKEGFDRPKITYEVLKAERRAEGFDDNIIVIEGRPLNSCDHAGPWKIGAIEHEVFFMDGDTLQPATINMRVNDMGKITDEE